MFTHAGMVNSNVTINSELRSSGNSNRRRSRVCRRVIATEVGTGHIGDRGLRIKVVGLADIDPVCSFHASDHKVREGVY